MPVVDYFSVEGQLIGEQINSVANTRLDYLTDALASVTTTVYQDGQIENSYRYKPYGDQLEKTGTAPDPNFRWIGTEGYTDTKLQYSEYYVRARHYGSGLGKWTTTDPIGYESGLNVYAYVDSRPTYYTDRSGNGPVPPVYNTPPGEYRPAGPGPTQYRPIPRPVPRPVPRPLPQPGRPASQPTPGIGAFFEPLLIPLVVPIIIAGAILCIFPSPAQAPPGPQPRQPNAPGMNCSQAYHDAEDTEKEIICARPHSCGYSDYQRRVSRGRSTAQYNCNDTARKMLNAANCAWKRRNITYQCYNGNWTAFGRPHLKPFLDAVTAINNCVSLFQALGCQGRIPSIPTP